ncbi:hypothetical protein FJZ33_00950 [Candidatus Poribacteria bacterium]|nr:hypothetical protein [Candidatus Poribacteria bacterium]
MVKFLFFNPIIRLTVFCMALYALFAIGVSADSDALDLRIIYSGDERGMLWPHGCGAEQIGGLDYRHTLIQSLYKNHKNVLNLHTGNIVQPDNLDNEVVYQIALEALSLTGFDAVCVGPKDLSLSVDSLKTLQSSHPDMPFACANVETKGLNTPIFQSYSIKGIQQNSKKSTKIAVISLISNAFQAEVEAYNPNLVLTDPVITLTKLSDNLAQEGDLVFVIYHASLKEAQKLAEDFPWLDVIIVSGDKYMEDSENPVSGPIIVENTTIVMNPPRGESVGVLDISLDHNKQVISRDNKLIQVSEQIEPSEEISALLRLYEDMTEVDGLEVKVAVHTDRVVHIAYFYKRGCEKCTHASQILQKIRDRHQEVAIEKRNVKENQELLEAMGQLYHIPEIKRLTTPTVFIGDSYFLDNLDEEQLEKVVQKYLSTGVESKLQQAEVMAGNARGKIISRFQSLGALTVAGAGLLDGINPCAFATIVLFVSYMSMVGRRKREMLMSGIAFTIAVFVTYLLLGMGALKFLEYINSFSIIGKVVYLFAAIATFTLAVFSFHDAYRAKHGRIKEIKLQLPSSLKSVIHKVIRRQVRTSGIVAGALVIGFAVSALELVCTGQVYLPTITFVAGVEGMKAYAFSYLLLYNLMFIVPLIVVFGFIYWGATFVQLGGVLQRHLMKVKLGTGILFLCLSIWLLLGVR